MSRMGSAKKEFPLDSATIQYYDNAFWLAISINWATLRPHAIRMGKRSFLLYLSYVYLSHTRCTSPLHNVYAHVVSTMHSAYSIWAFSALSEKKSVQYKNKCWEWVRSPHSINFCSSFFHSTRFASVSGCECEFAPFFPDSNLKLEFYVLASQRCTQSWVPKFSARKKPSRLFRIYIYIDCPMYFCRVHFFQTPCIRVCFGLWLSTPENS